jgi:hypothetical protein
MEESKKDFFNGDWGWLTMDDYFYSLTVTKMVENSYS